jgi:hypothetical protein
MASVTSMRASVCHILLGLCMLGSAQSSLAADMIVLHYLDQDPGAPPYASRILITPQFLRLDDGSDTSDFILLKRKTGELTNVLHSMKTNMRIRNKPLPVSARPTWRVEQRVEEMRPGTKRVTVLVKGKVCSQTVAAERLLPEAAKALAEYMAALAWTQYQTYQNTDPDMRQDCDLVHHVWNTGLALSYGLPIETRDYAGRSRQLEKQGTEKLRPGLFKLPEGYAVIYATQD